MSVQNNRPSIERQRFDLFMKAFRAGKYPQQRLGQAFHNEFKCHKIVSLKSELDVLWNKDGDEAIALIRKLFKIH